MGRPESESMKANDDNAIKVAADNVASQQAKPSNFFNSR